MLVEIGRSNLMVMIKLTYNKCFISKLSGDQNDDGQGIDSNSALESTSA